MPRTRIKICGITRPQDAALAAAVGADAVGIVLHEGAGRYAGTRAREILDALPAFVTPVGLFVDAPPDHIRRTAAALGLRHVQLHGREPVDTARALSEFRILKAIRMDAGARDELAEWVGARLSNLAGFVLESPGPGVGGTGQRNDWPLALALREGGAFDGVPVIAAGGLTPETVADVVRTLRPWSVDVSSGVEGAMRGQKDHVRVEAFVRAVRDADATTDPSDQ